MMPVLRQPHYLPQPIPWDEEAWTEGEERRENRQPESLTLQLPIHKTGTGDRCSGQQTGRWADEERWGNGGMEKGSVEQQKPVSSPQSQASSAYKEGYDAGYRDGFLAGQQEGYRQGVAATEQRFQEEQLRLHQHVQHLFQNLTEALQNEIAAFFERAEKAVAELALEIARKVIEVEVTTNPEVARRAVAQALQQLKGSTITVRLHPEDFSLLGNDLSLLNLHESVSVQFVPDESVERGGVVAESEQGLVDLQPRTKLALLHSEVL